MESASESFLAKACLINAATPKYAFIRRNYWQEGIRLIDCGVYFA